MNEEPLDAVDVTYRLADLYAITFQSWRWHFIWVLCFLGILLVALVAIPVVTVGKNLGDAIVNFPWALGLGLAVFVLALRLGISPLAGYLDARRDGDIVANQFEVSKEGVRVQNNYSTSLVYWSALRRVSATGNRLFLFTGRGRGFILPRRAFESRAHFEAVVERATKRWMAARA